MAIITTRWDSAEHLKTEEDIQLYLEAALEEAGDDPGGQPRGRGAGDPARGPAGGAGVRGGAVVGRRCPDQRPGAGAIPARALGRDPAVRGGGGAPRRGP